jgi:CheY-like chemotaxis protein
VSTRAFALPGRSYMAVSILVVEDDADIRSALTTILREEGYGVASAGDGREALGLLRGGARPDLILLDLMMPVMNGSDFRVAQLSDPALADIPVVVLTANGRFRDAARMLGAADAFGKPFDLDALLASIERVTQTRSHARALASA